MSEPHTPAPFRKTPAIDLVAMETQPKASKPAPAEQTQTLADEGRLQQPPDITLASTPAVVQPIQPQPLADEVADEGHAQQTPEVTPASTPAVVQPIQPIQPLADAGGTESVAEAPLPIGRWAGRHLLMNKASILSEKRMRKPIKLWVQFDLRIS